MNETTFEQQKEIFCQENKEKNFIKKGTNLGLPLDFCQTVFLFLTSSIISTEGFYQIFNNVYSKDVIFNNLKIMINNGLLIIDEDESDFDDTCMLGLAFEYDKNFN